MKIIQWERLNKAHKPIRGPSINVNSLNFGPRLSKRGYTGTKLEENLQAEIFQTILDEAREAYREEIVIELQSEEEGAKALISPSPTK